MHAGDVGGWHGTTLQQLADQCLQMVVGPQQPGVVCSAPVRMLLGGDGTIVFETVSDALVRIERASATHPPPGTDSAPSIQPAADRAAGWIASRVARSLAGRDAELETARTAVDAARSSGIAPLVIVTGEAGMGKTRLLAEFAQRAGASGDVVLVGRCTEMGGAFEPFLERWVTSSSPSTPGTWSATRKGGSTADASSANSVGPPRARSALQPRDRRHAVDRWIVARTPHPAARRRRPIAHHRCRLSARRRSQVLGELTLRPGSAQVTVGPLTAADIASMASSSGLDLGTTRSTGSTRSPVGAPSSASSSSATSAMHRRRLRHEHLPAGVREWVLQRVDRLGDGARDTLAPAAVVGRDFEVIVLADVLGASPLETLTHLDAAARAGLLVDGSHPGAFRFVHAIVRTTLEESLSATHRALLHAATARRLEEEGDDLDTLEAAMHHWFAADRLGDPLHAGQLAADVATRATERLAHERAITILCAPSTCSRGARRRRSATASKDASRRARARRVRGVAQHRSGRTAVSSCRPRGVRQRPGDTRRGGAGRVAQPPSRPRRPGAAAAARASERALPARAGRPPRNAPRSPFTAAAPHRPPRGAVVDGRDWPSSISI